MSYNRVGIAGWLHRQEQHRLTSLIYNIIKGCVDFYEESPFLGRIVNLNLGNYMDKREKYWIPMLLAIVLLTHEVAYILLK